jgi:3-oxoadipate enol-lactonase
VRWTAASAVGAVHAQRRGRRGGPPVVFVHAVGLDLGYWDLQAEALEATHDVIAFDLPGHGRSGGEPRDIGFVQLAAALAAVVEWAGAGPAHIVGLSVGGMVAQTLALARPDLVHSLALIGTACTFPAAGRQALRDRAALTRAGGMQAAVPPTLDRWFTGDFRARRPDMVARVTKTLHAADPAIHAAMWDMIAGLETCAGLGRIGCPALVLVGELDPSTPPAAARTLAAAIAAARLEVLPDASHMSPLEIPDVVNGHLRRFLPAP